MSRFCLHLFLQDNYHPTGVELGLKLNWSLPDFCPVGTETVAVKITEVVFKVRTVDILPRVTNGLNQAIAQHNISIHHASVLCV